jgi:hypothetical protein
MSDQDLNPVHMESSPIRMPTNSIRITGIIHLANNHEFTDLDQDPRLLTSELEWQVDRGTLSKTIVTPVSPGHWIGRDELARPATSVQVDADLETISAELDVEYQRLLAC